MSNPTVRDGPTRMPLVCRCSHSAAKHEIPGFDGSCIAERCRCTALSAVVRGQVPSRTPTPLPAGERALVDAWGDVLEVDAAGVGVTGHRRGRG